MTTIVINERSIGAKKLIEFLKTQPFVTIVEEKMPSPSVTSNNDAKDGESPYNKEFVRIIQKSRASKGKVIKTADLWK